MGRKGKEDLLKKWCVNRDLKAELVLVRRSSVLGGESSEGSSLCRSRELRPVGSGLGGGMS